MNLICDGRVLAHKVHTGVENYTKYILENIYDKLDVNVVSPTVANKYLAHLWTHFVLPFKKGNVLFCPANSAPIFVPKNKKLLITIHDIAFLTYKKSFSKFFYMYYSFLIPHNLKRADKIITVSEASKKEIISLFPNVADKVIVIALGIDDKYRVTKGLKKKKQILYVGSINERKNLIGVIEAFEKLSKDLNYTLVIVGNFFDIFSLSDKMKETLSRAEKNDKIIFKQDLDDEALIEEYNISTMLLFPSFYEGFGLPPLESMACGTPVITSNLSSMPEVCGDAALYVNPHSIDDIAKKIEMLIDDKNLQKELIDKGFERVKKFTWKKAAQEHIKVIKELA